MKLEIVMRLSDGDTAASRECALDLPYTTSEKDALERLTNMVVAGVDIEDIVSRLFSDVQAEMVGVDNTEPVNSNDEPTKDEK